MNEASMPKTVLCIATTRLAREMLRKEGCYEGEECKGKNSSAHLVSKGSSGQADTCSAMSVSELPLSAAENWLRTIFYHECIMIWLH